VPSINVKSKWGRVFPTSVPTSGWSTMTAALRGAAVGPTAGAGVDAGGAVAPGTTVASDNVTGDGIVVVPAAIAAGAAIVGLLTAAASGTGVSVGDWMDGLADVDAGGALVAVVPQAKTPIMSAINSKVSSRDIS
jgi:hypothetical protein